MSKKIAVQTVVGGIKKIGSNTPGERNGLIIYYYIRTLQPLSVRLLLTMNGFQKYKGCFICFVFVLFFV